MSLWSWSTHRGWTEPRIRCRGESGERERDWPDISRETQDWMGLDSQTPLREALGPWTAPGIGVGNRSTGPAGAILQSLLDAHGNLLGRQALYKAGAVSRLGKALRSMPPLPFPSHPGPGPDQLVCYVVHDVGIVQATALVRPPALDIDAGFALQVGQMEVVPGVGAGGSLRTGHPGRKTGDRPQEDGRQQAGPLRDLCPAWLTCQ